MEEEAVAGVDLDAVESRRDRPARGLCEIVDDFPQSCLRDWLGSGVREHLGTDSDGLGRDDVRGCQWGAVAVDARVGVAAGVHELQDDRSIVVVDGIDDLLPCLFVGVRDHVRTAWLVLPLPRRVGALGDDQARGGALAVVGGHPGPGCSPRWR